LTDVCVHYTFVDAHQHDYHVRVAEDVVGGSGQAAHDAALAAMEYLQTGALRSSAEIADAFATYRGAPRPGVAAPVPAGTSQLP
jgi:nicotinamidase-related amidase